MACLVQFGLERNYVLREVDIHKYKLPDGIGSRWKDLARELGFSEVTIDSIEKEKGTSLRECCIELLVLRWLRREGRDATAGKLADALTESGLKNVAEKLIKSEQINNFEIKIQQTTEQLVSYVKEEGSQMSARIKELEEEILKLRARNKELEDARQKENGIDRFERTIREMNEKLVSLRDEGFKMSARNKELQEEVAKMSARNKELQEENSKLRKGNKELEDVKQHGQGDLKDAVLFDTNDACVVWTDTNRAEREVHISKMLGNLNEKLNTYVTSPLEVPEINQDQLKTSVRLDLLTRLSKRLQELYTDMQTMVPEACKCSQDLKKEFHDFIHHGLRAQHNDLGHRVQDLETALEEMSEEEKQNFCQLKQYQVNRQRQVERLDNVWRRPECLPKTPLSDISGTNGKSNESQKDSRHSDPGARPKQTKSKDTGSESETPSVNCDGGNTDEVCLNISKVTSAKSIFRKKKKKGENMCTLASCSLRRDS